MNTTTITHVCSAFDLYVDTHSQRMVSAIPNATNLSVVPLYVAQLSGVSTFGTSISALPAANFANITSIATTLTYFVSGM